MNTPLHRLGSLDLLRGFVAVGRRMSITLAARDLCLSQSAVSRQVRALEEALGVRLLTRGYRSIALTPEGERLFRVADEAVRQLQTVWGSLKEAASHAPVTIGGCVSVTGLWLLPRLGRFQLRHPGIEVRVASNDRPVDAKREGIDLAMRYLPEDAAPEGAVRLFGDLVLPVAHPSLAHRFPSMAAALGDAVLLEFDNPAYPWLQWPGFLGELGLEGWRPPRVLRFNQYSQVIQAAVAGQGVALGRLALVEPLLADGRLVALSPEGAARASGFAYWLLQTDPNPRQDVLDVAAWIRAEASHASDACEDGENLI